MPALAPERAEEDAAAFDKREGSATEGLAPFPGARELLGSLPRGRWAVVTSGSTRLAKSRLQACWLPSPSCSCLQTTFRMASRTLSAICWAPGVLESDPRKPFHRGHRRYAGRDPGRARCRDAGDSHQHYASKGSTGRGRIEAASDGARARPPPTDDHATRRRSRRTERTAA